MWCPDYSQTDIQQLVSLMGTLRPFSARIPCIIYSRTPCVYGQYIEAAVDWLYILLGLSKTPVMDTREVVCCVRLICYNPYSMLLVHYTVMLQTKSYVKSERNSGIESSPLTWCCFYQSLIILQMARIYLNSTIHIDGACYQIILRNPLRLQLFKFH